MFPQGAPNNAIIKAKFSRKNNIKTPIIIFFRIFINFNLNFSRYFFSIFAKDTLATNSQIYELIIFDKVK